jgi:hypothetical protein
MGAELSAFEHARILIPIVSRNEYQVALRAMSRDGRCDLYIRTLAWAWRWTSGMPWHDRATRLVAAPSTAPRFAALEQLICCAHRFASRAGLCSQRLSPTTFARDSYHCPRTPGGGDRLSRQPHLGDEVGQVLQRVVEVVRPERRELEILAHLGRDR